MNSLLSILANSAPRLPYHPLLHNSYLWASPLPLPPIHPCLLLPPRISIPLSLIHCSVSEAVQVVSKKPIPPHVKDLVLEMCCNDDEGEDVDVPFIQYRFR